MQLFRLLSVVVVNNEHSSKQTIHQTSVRREKNCINKLYEIVVLISWTTYDRTILPRLMEDLGMWIPPPPGLGGERYSICCFFFVENKKPGFVGLFGNCLYLLTVVSDWILYGSWPNSIPLPFLSEELGGVPQLSAWVVFIFRHSDVQANLLLTPEVQHGLFMFISCVLRCYVDFMFDLVSFGVKYVVHYHDQVMTNIPKSQIVAGRFCKMPFGRISFQRTPSLSKVL